MYPSADLCRTQEAFHRNRAAAASLANVRMTSEKAAAAWGGEALAAERREQRQRDRSLSENPDRGFAA